MNWKPSSGLQTQMNHLQSNILSGQITLFCVYTLHEFKSYVILLSHRQWSVSLISHIINKKDLVILDLVTKSRFFYFQWADIFRIQLHRNEWRCDFKGQSPKCVHTQRRQQDRSRILTTWRRKQNATHNSTRHDVYFVCIFKQNLFTLKKEKRFLG